MKRIQAVRDLTPPAPTLTPLYKILIYAGVVIAPIAFYLTPMARIAGYSIYSISCFNALLGFMLGSMIAKLILLSAQIKSLQSWQLKHIAAIDLGAIRFNNHELRRLRVLTDALAEEVYALKQAMNPSKPTPNANWAYLTEQNIPSVASLLKKQDV